MTDRSQDPPQADQEQDPSLAVQREVLAALRAILGLLRPRMERSTEKLVRRQRARKQRRRAVYEGGWLSVLFCVVLCLFGNFNDRLTEALPLLPGMAVTVAAVLVVMLFVGWILTDGGPPGAALFFGVLFGLILGGVAWWQFDSSHPGYSLLALSAPVVACLVTYTWLARRPDPDDDLR